jgi:hypothetical protein
MGLIAQEKANVKNKIAGKSIKIRDADSCGAGRAGWHIVHGHKDAILPGARLTGLPILPDECQISIFQGGLTFSC